jgi:hypothetical protein
MYFIFGHAKDLSFRIFPQAQEQFCGVLIVFVKDSFVFVKEYSVILSY